MDPSKLKKSSNIEDRTVFPADPSGPRSTLPDPLLAIAFRQLAERIASYNRREDSTLSPTISGYAKMLAHGALPTSGMEAMQNAISEKTMTAPGSQAAIDAAMLDLQWRGSREMGTDVRGRYAAALTNLLRGTLWSEDQSAIARMKAMLGLDQDTNRDLALYQERKALHEKYHWPMDPQAQWGYDSSLRPPVSWGLELPPYSDVPLGSEEVVKRPKGGWK